MPMDRPSIQRSNFPTGRRGYDPAAVDAHLSTVADEVERLRKGAGQPVAAAASEQVRRIVEAAEASAEQILTEAGEEAREHVQRVSTAARELLERVSSVHDELGGLMDRLREDAQRLSSELRALERDVVEVGGAPVDEGLLELEPEPVAEDDEAARIVALDMALSGTPREETERYLAQHYALSAPGELLDDVYALAGQ